MIGGQSIRDAAHAVVIGGEGDLVGMVERLGVDPDVAPFLLYEFADGYLDAYLVHRRVIGPAAAGIPEPLRDEIRKLVLSAFAVGVSVGREAAHDEAPV